MKRSSTFAFTLIELLIVIGIVSVLASIILPVFGSMQTTAKRTQSLSNMRQLGTALLAYCGDNNGVFPTEGSATPAWGASGTTETTAWYNILPRNYANSKGVGDFSSGTAAQFYTKGSLLYVPAAKYPSTKNTAPLFAIAYCSKLHTSTTGDNLVRLTNFQNPAETVVFQENGLPGETPVRGQKAYTNQSKGYASRTAFRYAGRTIITFADGHSETEASSDVVTTAGKAYSPQISPAGGKVYWTMDPTADANQ